MVDLVIVMDQVEEKKGKCFRYATEICKETVEDTCLDIEYWEQRSYFA